MIHARKEMMFNLIVEATVDKAQERASNIGRGSDLSIEKGVIHLWVGIIKHMDTLKIVRNHEKEGQVIASHNKHWRDIQKSREGRF